MKRRKTGFISERTVLLQPDEKKMPEDEHDVKTTVIDPSAARRAPRL
jgi:hypothetical protein